MKRPPNATICPMSRKMKLADSSKCPRPQLRHAGLNDAGQVELPDGVEQRVDAGVEPHAVLAMYVVRRNVHQEVHPSLKA